MRSEWRMVASGRSFECCLVGGARLFVQLEAACIDLGQDLRGPPLG